MFVRLADEGVHFLFEWQRDTDTNRALESLGVELSAPLRLLPALDRGRRR